MSNVSEQSWEEFNRAYLLEALDDLREALRMHDEVTPIEGDE